MECVTFQMKSAYDPVTGIVYGMCDVSSEVSAYDSVTGISYGMSDFSK